MRERNFPLGTFPNPFFVTPLVLSQADFQVLDVSRKGGDFENSNMQIVEE